MAINVRIDSSQSPDEVWLGPDEIWINGALYMFEITRMRDRYTWFRLDGDGWIHAPMTGVDYSSAQEAHIAAVCALVRALS